MVAGARCRFAMPNTAKVWETLQGGARHGARASVCLHLRHASYGKFQTSMAFASAAATASCATAASASVGYTIKNSGR